MTLQGSDNVRLEKRGKLAELDEHRTSNPVMVGVVSSIPTGGNFNFLLKLFKIPRCHYCTEMSDLSYERKSRVDVKKNLINQVNVRFELTTY